MIYFISDHHWGHSAIIWMSNRPFMDVWEMNNHMVDAWNSVVTAEDEVYHLGDVSYKMNLNLLKNKILPRLNGKIHLIVGNHDKERVLNKIGDRFETIKDYDVLFYTHEGKEYKIVLFHYPIYSWNGRYKNSIHLHGHTHIGNADDNSVSVIPGNIMNVSAEHLGYVPISIVDVINRFKDKGFKHK